MPAELFILLKFELSRRGGSCQASPLALAGMLSIMIANTLFLPCVHCAGQSAPRKFKAQHDSHDRSGKLICACHS